MLEDAQASFNVGFVVSVFLKWPDDAAGSGTQSCWWSVQAW